MYKMVFSHLDGRLHSAAPWPAPGHWRVTSSLSFVISTSNPRSDKRAAVTSSRSVFLGLASVDCHRVAQGGRLPELQNLAERSLDQVLHTAL